MQQARGCGWVVQQRGQGAPCARASHRIGKDNQQQTADASEAWVSPTKGVQVVSRALHWLYPCILHGNYTMTCLIYWSLVP